MNNDNAPIFSADTVWNIVEYLLGLVGVLLYHKQKDTDNKQEAALERIQKLENQVFRIEVVGDATGMFKGLYTGEERRKKPRKTDD